MSILNPEKKIIIPERKLKQIQPMQRAKFRPDVPERKIDYRLKAKYAEPTGLGDTLCLETCFGRLFRSDEGCVRDQTDEFIYLYQSMCKTFDDNPISENRGILEFNELYFTYGLLPIASVPIWGYPIMEGYHPKLSCNIELRTDDHLASEYGEPYVRIEFPEEAWPEICAYEFND